LELPQRGMGVRIGLLWRRCFNVGVVDHGGGDNGGKQVPEVRAPMVIGGDRAGSFAKVPGERIMHKMPGPGCACGVWEGGHQ